MVAEIIDLSLLEYLDIANKDEGHSDYIYRGQTNGYNGNNEFQIWPVISNYNRNGQFKEIPFNSFINQQLENNLFDIYYKDNKFVEQNKLAKADLITKLFFLQHYGVSTCLIDFTHNPLVALFFGMTGLEARTNEKRFQNEHISIYQINYKLLKDKLGIAGLSNQLVAEYDSKYKFELLRSKPIYLGIEEDPLSRNFQMPYNFNLKQQEGAFIFFDNWRNRDCDLISFIQDYVINHKSHIEEPIVKVFNIKYNELYKPSLSKNPICKSAFQILKDRKKTGSHLFNDIQGLKYDLVFFSEL
ncbi:FRG domain-containing protein [Formosa algae]|uniref:FRG domain-containing protein n=1 Tax=Formosa algae TaxID=225843 RepID=UPI000CCF8925|nr:FRG domain-containing protein [Formosa algae]PNW27410.1 hypothetical protein BKP44_13345 [Formosa algae]